MIKASRPRKEVCTDVDMGAQGCAGEHGLGLSESEAELEHGQHD